MLATTRKVLENWILNFRE